MNNELFIRKIRFLHLRVPTACALFHSRRGFDSSIHWSVKRLTFVIRFRKCNDTQIFVKNALTHCIDTCKERTMCGEVEVPEEHLDACRTCNTTGQDCGIAKGSRAGDGIRDFDFVFYVSAMQTDRCNKSLTVAYAAHCQQESAFDRFVNFVYSKIQ